MTCGGSNRIGRGASMEARRVRIFTLFMVILFLLAIFDLVYMEFVSVGDFLGLSFYLIGISLSMSYLTELSISITIRPNRFTISFKQIRLSRIIVNGFFMVYGFLFDIQLIEGPFFPDIFDLWTWLLFAVYLISWIIGNYVARHLLYPNGDIRLAHYDALAEKNQ